MKAKANKEIEIQDSDLLQMGPHEFKILVSLKSEDGRLSLSIHVSFVI